ncbi:MAG: GMC family oxidoreductase N-terminal domain-containing protein [Bacteroidia bacterium]
MYDYIIIGAGSAGCVLAHRLTEDPQVRVLLIEAGGKDTKPEIRIPAAFSKLFKTRYDWNYSTPPQPHAGGRSLYLPRGRVLGGCSSINAMIYIRGHRLDYDAWAAAGNKGWSYADVLPYFCKSEDQLRGSDAWHGAGGPQVISDLQEPFPVTRAFVEAGRELGYPVNPDFNGAGQEGFGIYQVTQRDGRRMSTAEAFLKPILHRPNLTVQTDTLVQRIVVENRRAVGIEYRTPTHIQEIRARREVILAAGAYNSPQLLMLSGIGPAEELRRHGIAVKHDLPGVGQHLLDHLIVPMVFHNRDKHTLDEATRWYHLANYYIWAEGPLSSNVAEGGAFIRTREELAAPDIQFHFAPGYFLNHGFDNPGKGHGLSMGPTLLQPRSVGSVRLASARPEDAPVIDHRYLEAQEDVDTLVAGMKVGYQLIDTRALRAYFAGFYYPRKRLRSDAELAEHVRMSAQTLYHPVGTCRMGQDERAVVDEQLRVRGIEGLRIVDASVMPAIVRGNTHAPVMMIAEKAAAMIRLRIEATRNDRIAVPLAQASDN